MKCSINEALFKEFFLLRFRFQIYCSFFNFIMKLRKAFIKVVKTSRFALVRIKKMYPRNVHEVDLELGGGELSLSACPGVRNRPPRKKTLQIPGGSLPEGEGAWLQINLNHALSLHAIFSAFSWQIFPNKIDPGQKCFHWPRQTR